MNPKQLEKEIQDLKRWKENGTTKITEDGDTTQNAIVDVVSLSTSTISMSDFEKAKKALQKADIPSVT